MSEPVKPGKVFFTVYTILLLAGNIFIDFDAIKSGGWGGIGLLLMVSPVYNGVFFITGLIKAIIMDHKYPGGSGRPWLIGVVLPIVLIIVSLAILASGVTGGGC